MTKLSVNINKIALLRNARKGSLPDVIDMARRAIESGAHGITVHPRPDQRHIRYSDVIELSKMIARFPGIEFNIEGNPIPKFCDIVLQVKPHQVTLVPDAEDQLTSDHGWDLRSDGLRIKPIIQQFRNSGIRVSVFMDPVASSMHLAKDVGADRVELYTEQYAQSFGSHLQQNVLLTYQKSAEAATVCGLGINAGHDLNLQNLGLLIATIPAIAEVSIGHALTVEAFDYTYEGVIKRYCSILENPQASMAAE